MLKAIEKILRYTKGMDLPAFKENELISDAVIRNFEVIGEASKNIPEHIKNKYPHIPWRQMYGLRNFITHEYFGVDYDTLWTIIDENLLKNKSDLENLIEEEKKKLS